MAPAFIPLERYRTKLYEKENNSKRFLELSEEQLSAVAKRVYKRQEGAADSLTQNTIIDSKLDRYQRTLQYLTNPLIHLELKTFDERIAYLIMMTDPELETLKEFLKTNLISEEAISKEEDINERNYLMIARMHTLSEYETRVRDKIGFYDSKLLKHEEMFFKEYFNKRELVVDVGINSEDTLVSKTVKIKNFDCISDERYKELIDIAHTWIALVPEQYNSKIAAYSVMNQRELLGLKSLTEQLTLFILLVDSDLDMLRIYEEESMMPNVERRIIEEFGYYNPELLTLEKKFHKRFCPEKELSIWTKVKKD